MISRVYVPSWAWNLDPFEQKICLHLLRVGGFSKSIYWLAKQTKMNTMTARAALQRLEGLGIVLLNKSNSLSGHPVRIILLDQHKEEK